MALSWPLSTVSEIGQTFNENSGELWRWLDNIDGLSESLKSNYSMVKVSPRRVPYTREGARSNIGFYKAR